MIDKNEFFFPSPITEIDDDLCTTDKELDEKRVAAKKISESLDEACKGQDPRSHKSEHSFASSQSVSSSNVVIVDVSLFAEHLFSPSSHDDKFESLSECGISDES